MALAFHLLAHRSPAQVGWFRATGFPEESVFQPGRLFARKIDCAVDTSVLDLPADRLQTSRTAV